MDKRQIDRERPIGRSGSISSIGRIDIAIVSIGIGIGIGIVSIGIGIGIGISIAGFLGSTIAINAATQSREAGDTSSEGEKQLKKKKKRKFCSVM